MTTAKAQVVVHFNVMRLSRPPPVQAHTFLLRTLLFVVVLAIGWADHVTGPDFAFSLFYLLPIAAAGWSLGARTSLAVALAASVAWLAADLMERESSPAISAWNGFTRLVIYVSHGWMLSRLRAGRDRLEAGQQREYHLARTDSVTELPNARAFHECLSSELRAAQSSASTVSVIYIDIDNFKMVNDRYGHGRGDELLQSIAAVILMAFRTEDFFARLGGDEFAAVLPSSTESDANAAANNVLQGLWNLRSKFDNVPVSASVGIAHGEPAGQDADSFLRVADDAMYEAKQSGKNRIILRVLTTPSATLTLRNPELRVPRDAHWPFRPGSLDRSPTEPVIKRAPRS